MQFGSNFQSINTLKANIDSLRTTANFFDLANLTDFRKQAEKLGDHFDWQFYIKYYDDLNNVSDPKEAFEHWFVFGQFEGRLPNQEALETYFKIKKLSLPENFDPEKYGMLNPDLQKRFASNQYKNFKLLEHFFQHGQAEGRPYQTSFDWKFYLEYNDDLNHLTTPEAAYNHWQTVGQSEGRFTSETELTSWLQQKQTELPNDFDPAAYLNLNPDLQITFLDHKYKQYKATEHFLNHGKFAGRHYSYACLKALAKNCCVSDLSQLEIQQKALELYSALFNNPHYLQQTSQIVQEGSSCLIHFIQNNIEVPQLVNKELHHLAEAITLYRIALQLQPSSADVVSRLDSILDYSNQLYQQHNYGNYECDDEPYAQWLRENAPNCSDLRRMAAAVSSFSYKPLISVILPVYNTPESFLREALQSVLNQIYPYWELCIADDQSTHSHVRSILEEYAAQDSRIKLIFRSTNGHISACSNSALALATGEFVTLLDHDDVITPDALYEVALLLNQHPEADMIYSDEDKLTEQGQLISPYFKPDWCPDSFLTRRYTCHLGVYRRVLIDQIGGFRLGYEGSQDYDLVLRLTEQTDKIFHIPKILYHWRMHSASTASDAAAKPYAYEAAIKSLRDALKRRGESGQIVSNSRFPGQFTVRYQIRQPRLVSIIISIKHLNYLERCLKSIFTKTTYTNYEVIVVNDNKHEPELFSLISYWQKQQPNQFRFYTVESSSNYSRVNNFAATKASGDYLLFLSDSTEIITSDWIEAMIEQAQRPSIGAVGALLLYPDNSIQHTGIILGVQGVASHSHRYFSKDAAGYFGQLATVNNYSAVTGACLMCRRDVFAQVGGFDEQFATAYNDIDLCLKLLQQGYRHVHLPHVELYYYESERQDHTESAAHLLQQRWQEYIRRDPCYSPHLTREAEDYGIRINSDTSIEVLAANYANYSESSLSGLLWGFSIDCLHPGATYKNFIPLQGWILGKWSAVTAIEIIRNQQVIRSIPVNHFRPDVKQIYPTIPNSEYSGFMKRIAVVDMPSMTQLSLQAVLANEARLPLGTVQIKIANTNQSNSQ